MDPIQALYFAVERIREPRLFATERGYQGHLAAQIDQFLEDEPDSILRPLVEEEYQKTAALHGVTLRPDIIVHIPFDRGVSPSRKHDNHMVILLKLSANKTEAEDDFAKLETICSVLDYPLGVFVNIASQDLWLPQYRRQTTGPFVLHELAVCLVEGAPMLLNAKG